MPTTRGMRIHLAKAREHSRGGSTANRGQNRRREKSGVANSRMATTIGLIPGYRAYGSGRTQELHFRDCCGGGVQAKMHCTPSPRKTMARKKKHANGSGNATPCFARCWYLQPELHSPAAPDPR